MKKLLLIIILISAYKSQAMHDLPAKENLIFSPTKRQFVVRQVQQPLSDEEYEEVLAQAHKELGAAQQRPLKRLKLENGNGENELESMWQKAVKEAEYKRKLRSRKF